MKSIFHLLPLIALSAIPLTITSCKKDATSQAETTPKVSLDRYFTETAPADPKSITALRETAKPGDQVTLTGLVMGRKKPFVDGRAAFILGDPGKLTPCNKIPDDHCETPWDACCDDPDVKRAGTATIQLVDADQRVLKQEIKGAHGLKELSSVTLTGTVDKTSTPEALIINATVLHVE